MSISSTDSNTSRSVNPGLNLDIRNDLALVGDGQVRVTVYRPESDLVNTISSVLFGSAKKRFVPENNPDGLSWCGVEWNLPLFPADSELPYDIQVGDVIRETFGGNAFGGNTSPSEQTVDWKILDITTRNHIGRMICDTIRLEFLPRLDGYVDILVPRWTTDENGIATAVWNEKYTGVYSRIVSLPTSGNQTHTNMNTERIEIVLGDESIKITKDCRLRLSNGHCGILLI